MSPTMATQSSGSQATENDGVELAADQRGAIMVMGVFMAMLMVGFIYYVSGLGEAVLFRERMQDASDAGAWAAAVLHARGMNIIAFINMLMAALAAVLIAMNILIVLLKAAIVIGGVMQAFPPTTAAGVAIVGVAQPLKEAVVQARDAVKQVVERVLPILTKAGRAVKVAIPPLAEVKVIAVATSDWNETVQFGAYYGTTLTDLSLPLEDGECSEIEDRGKEYVAELASRPFGSGVLHDIVESVMDSLGDISTFVEGSICEGSDNGGYNSQTATTQTIGEQCTGNAEISPQQLAGCIGAATFLCWGSSSSSQHLSFDDSDDYYAFQQNCGDLASANCEEVTQCRQALEQAGNQPPDTDGSGATNLGSEVAPQRVKGDSNLGDNSFQIRAFMISQGGELDPGLRNVQLGNWGQPVPDAALDNLAFLSRVGVAQSEFYYDDDAAHTLRDDWMWHMNWKARMRRFSIGDIGMLNTACGANGGGDVCDSLSSISDTLQNIVVH